MLLIFIYSVIVILRLVSGEGSTVIENLTVGENSTVSETSTDYCNQMLYCPTSKEPHIACNNDGGFGPKCPDNAYLIEIDDYHTNKITDLHNFYRNQIALGEVESFFGATRMAKMTWSEELANLAQLHVERCLFEHDGCRNTDEFKNSGQNIYMWSGYPGPTDTYEVMDIIYEGLSDWYAENSNANVDLINSFNITEEQTGHFTTMIKEQNTCLGCAGVTFTNKYANLEQTVIIFTCNYATNNILGYRTYEAGEPGSKCLTGTGEYYTGLCKESEYFNPNQHYKANI